MTIDTFENLFFSNLENNDIKYINDIIDSYSKLIKECYCEKGNVKCVRKFLIRFNDIILNNKNDYNIFTTVLNHPYFVHIHEEFRNSNILIKACKLNNRNAINWLMTMNINSCVQDDNGTTALMYASQNPELTDVVKYLCKDRDCIELEDKKHETAVFYAVRNIEAFRVLVNSSVNINHLNIDNDSILTYCCKYRIFEIFRTLRIANNLDRNIRNNDDMTAAMYLIEYEKYYELQMIIDESMNFNYKNRNNETAMSLLFKKYYKYYQKENIDKIKTMWYIIKLLIDNNVNFNVSIDKDGNTPLMFLIMIEDWYTIKYLLTNSKKLNISLRNSNGEDAIIIMNLKISQKFDDEMKEIANLLFEKNHSNKCSDFTDSAGNNLLMYSALTDSEKSAEYLIMDNFELVNQTNKNQENALIVCAKLGAYEIAKEIFKYRFIRINGQILKTKFTDINHKDIKGNTALHYAIQLKDYNMVNLLSHYKADQNIKNNEGLSPMELAGNDKIIIKCLNKPKMSNNYDIINEYQDLRDKYRKAYELPFEHNYQANTNLDSTKLNFMSNEIYTVIIDVNVDKDTESEKKNKKPLLFPLILLAILFILFDFCIALAVKLNN